MTDKRDTYKYKFLVDGKIVHHGITNDLDRREKEHQNSRSSWEKGKIEQIGSAVTHESAKEWERDQSKTQTPPR